MHDRSDGGVLATLLEMSFAGRLGIDIEVPESDDVLAALFNEEIGFALQIAAGDLASLKSRSAGQAVA